MSFKKILAFLMCIAMLGQSCFTAAYASAADEAYNEKYELLTALGIVNDKVVIDNKNITRGEFAVLLANLTGFEEGGDEKSQFVDVEDEYFAKKEINYVASKGYMKGISNDKFCPGYNVATDSAYQILLTAMGYGVYAAKANGGYTAVAASVGLSKGVNADRMLSKQAAVRLFYNALDTGILSASEYSISNGNVLQKMETEETPLTKWLKLDYVEGLVKRVGTSAVSRDYTSGGGLLIGNTTLKLSKDDNFYDCLGLVCRAYYGTEDDELRAVVVKESKNNITEFGTDNCTLADGTLRYNSGKGMKSMELSAVDDIVLNGVPVAAAERENAINNADGKIIINEVREHDGKIVMITSYETIYVSGLSQESTTIYDKVSEGRKLVLDYENAMTDVRYADGTVCEFSQIKSGDVLSVLKHGTGSDVTVIISEESVDGKVTSVSLTGGDRYISLGGKEYTITKDLVNSSLSMPRSGDGVTIKLDVFGRCAYIEDTDTSGYTYGFIYKHYLSEDDELLLKLKIYTMSGSFETLNTRKKMRVDGETMDTPAKKITALSNGNGTNGIYRLVRYQVNTSNEITDIDTLYRGTNESADNTLTRVHTLTSDGSIYKQVPKAFGGTGSVGLKVITDSQTIVLSVPKLQTGDTKVFKLGKSLENDITYSFEAYKSRSKDIPVDIIVFYEDTASVDRYAYGIITDVQKIYDEGENAAVTKVSVSTTTEGEKVYTTEYGFELNNSRDIEDTVSMTAEKGDIVKLALNSQDEIQGIGIYFDASAKTWLASTSPYGSIYNDHFYYGTIYRKDTGSLQISKGKTVTALADSELAPIPLASNVQYYKFDTAMRTLEEITFDELLSFEGVAAGASEAVVVTRAASGRLVIVYE